MSGLILKLGPKERILINGAVIENGDRRSRLAIVSSDANILRLRDAIHPQEATTPVRRVCYAVQLVLSGDSDKSEVRQWLLRSVEELSQIFVDTDSRKHLDAAQSSEPARRSPRNGPPILAVDTQPVPLWGATRRTHLLFLRS